ncbi:MAG: hypothetical protein RIS29_1298 [Bacteroidota bacterium]|jgi:hypothetical protein
MKKIFFSLLALAAVMVSCSTSDDVSSSASSTSGSSIAAYVADNYPSTTVVSTSSTRSLVTATLNTGETITFSKTTGSVIAYANNSSAGLAADSLATSDSTAHRDHKHHGPKGKHGHPRHGHNEVAIDSLSTTINDYIAANYASYKVIHAQKDTLCSGIVTSVMVCDSTKEPVKLVFNSSGIFVMSGVRALSASFPTAVLTAVTSSFADYTLRTRGSVYTLADGTIEYKVYLKSDSVKNKAVFFNADGTIACEL